MVKSHCMNARVRFLATVLGLLASTGCLAQSPPPPQTMAAPRFLTAGTGFQDYWPCFSPYGEDILFSRSFDGGKSWELWIVRVQSGTPHRLAKLPVSGTRANWSVKNHLIAFTGESKSGKSGVWIMNSSGTNARQQVLDGLSDLMVYPSWYPNGDQLAVTDGRELEIKRINLSQNSVTTLTDHDRVWTGMPSVSPDGRWIAFAGQLYSGQKQYDQTKNSIWILDVSDGAVRSLEATPKRGRAPSWSPDSKRVAFESDRGVPGRYAVFVVNLDGTGLEQITDYDLNANHPVWSPNGRMLAFSASGPPQFDGTRLALVDVATPR
jgi:Tol biopolymer transport system component